MIGVRIALVALGASAIVIPLVAPQHQGQTEPDGWSAVGGALTCIFLLMLVAYGLLPLNLTMPRVSAGPVLTVVTMRGARHVRLDALTKVGAIEPASRGTPSVFVWLRDADGGRVLASFKSSDPLPAALCHGAAALARRDPGAVSSRARHYLDLPDAPGTARRLAQGAVTFVVGMGAMVILLAISVGWVALWQ